METFTLPNINPWIMLVIMLWSIPWKGIALWKAAQISNKKWFIALLIFNTIGILDIIFIYFVASKYTVETENKIEMKEE